MLSAYSINSSLFFLHCKASAVAHSFFLCYNYNFCYQLFSLQLSCWRFYALPFLWQLLTYFLFYFLRFCYAFLDISFCFCIPSHYLPLCFNLFFQYSFVTFNFFIYFLYCFLHFLPCACQYQLFPTAFHTHLPT